MSRRATNLVTVPSCLNAAPADDGNDPDRPNDQEGSQDEERTQHQSRLESLAGTVGCDRGHDRCVSSFCSKFADLLTWSVSPINDSCSNSFLGSLASRDHRANAG